MPLIIHLFVFFSDQVQLRQSFTNLRYQYINYKMSSTTLTRQCARNSLNAELIDDSEFDVIEKANCARNSKKGKADEWKQQTAVSLGEVAWDQMFVEGGMDLPTTSFMERLK